MGRARGKHDVRKPVIDPDSGEGREIGMSDRMAQGGPEGKDKSPIPGGISHLANKPVVRQEAPIPVPGPEYEGIMAHGVPPSEHTTTERAEAERGPNTAHDPEPKYLPLPKKAAAVPVQIVQTRKIYSVATSSYSIPAQGSAAVRIAGRDYTRTHILLLVETAAGSGGVPIAGSNGAFTAGAAGSATLPAGSTLTGFDITVSAATAAGLATVTVSNVLGANYTYQIQEETGGGAILSIRYPGTGLPASTPASVPTVSIGVLASGGSGSIAIYGSSPATSAPTGIRFDHEVSELDVGKGTLLRAGAGSYLRLACNDELFAVSNDGSACTLSVIMLYGIAETG